MTAIRVLVGTRKGAFSPDIRRGAPQLVRGWPAFRRLGAFITGLARGPAKSDGSNGTTQGSDGDTQGPQMPQGESNKFTYDTHDAPTAPLPDDVVSGAEPFLIIGAIAGG